jgi:asparagine synthase (glutamine-hydrolysing)
MKMPVFAKRRFQHGAVAVNSLRERLPSREADYRRDFLALFGQ